MTSKAFGIVLVVGLMALAPSGGADEPFTLDDLLLHLRSGIPEAAIVLDVRAKGVAEPLTAEGERRLRSWGASDALIAAIRERSVRAPTSAFPDGRAKPAAAPETVDSAAPYVFAASAELVRVPVSVTDKRRQPVTGLRQEDFRVWEDGELQPITLFSAERKALMVAILIDVSGSMDVKLDAVADALRHFIDALEPDDQMMIVVFSDRLRILQDFTSDRPLLGRVLERLSAGGSTSLYDALMEGFARLGPVPEESKALVLVTDGVDTASRTSFEDALKAARQSAVPVYSIGLGHRRGFLHFGGGADDAADFDERPLRELARLTGGRAEILRDAEHHHRGNVDRLKDAAVSIALTLRHRYLVAYAPPRPSKPGWREIRVEVSRAGAAVDVRKGYDSPGDANRR